MEAVDTEEGNKEDCRETTNAVVLADKSGGKDIDYGGKPENCCFDGADDIVNGSKSKMSECEKQQNRMSAAR